jgi:predicted O-methyltransferase YrrM
MISNVLDPTGGLLAGGASAAGGAGGGLDRPESVGMPPGPVARATAHAERAGFTMSCDPGTGAFLAVLAAAVPPGGRILELGTGAGVGTAWIVHGLGSRTDVEVVTVDINPVELTLPSYVRAVVGDAVAVTGGEGTFDLVFADAPGGKWHGLDVTIAALRPGGHLLVDDMTLPGSPDPYHERMTAEVRATLLEHPDLVSVPMAWASGLILSTRRGATDLVS